METNDVLMRHFFDLQMFYVPRVLHQGKNGRKLKRGAMMEFRRETTSRFYYGGCVEREREREGGSTLDADVPI